MMSLSLPVMKTKRKNVSGLKKSKQNGTEQFDMFIYDMLIEDFLFGGTDLTGSKKKNKNFNKRSEKIENQKNSV
jgi:hypothetical protein